MLAGPGLDILRLLPPTNNGAGSTQSNNRSTYRSNIYELRYRSGAIMGGRQAACGCRMINKREGVAVVRDKDGRDFYSGVQTCGSVWTCPVCSLKISQQRKIEVQDILHKMQVDGNALGFLTLTWKHKTGETLRDVLKRGMVVYRDLMKHRALKQLKSGCDFLGDIRALEIKFGVNGWHPHLHIALVANCKQDTLAAYANALQQMWVAMHAGNASPDAQHYAPISSDKGIANYITKWDASDEMTKANSKVRSSVASLTPFALLEQAGNKQLPEQQRKFFVARFREYGLAMKGRKQLTKGRKLLEHYKNICFAMRERAQDEKTDEEIANAKHEGELQFNLEPELYEFVVEQKLQAHLLNAYQSGGVEDIAAMLMEFGVFIDLDPRTLQISIADTG